MNSPRRGGSSSRASSAAASTLKRPRQSDDAVSAHSPLAGGDKIPPRKKLAKTMSLPVSSCPKSNEGNGSQDKGKQVVTPPRLSKFTPLLYLSTVALDSSSSGSSSATKASRAVSTDSDIGEASPQEWVRSQAKKKRIKSAHGATVSPIGKGLQRRPFSLGVGVSLDTAIEIPSSDSSHSSIELLEDKSHWEVKEIMSHGVSGHIPRSCFPSSTVANGVPHRRASGFQVTFEDQPTIFFCTPHDASSQQEKLAHQETVS